MRFKKCIVLAVGLIIACAISGGSLQPSEARSEPAGVFSNATTAALADAVAADDAPAVRALTANGASLADKGKDDTNLLQWAMIRDRPRMLKLLLELGADPAQPGYHGMTALHAAAGAKGKPFLQILLDGGANPNARDGRTQASVIAQALMTGNADGVALLLSRKADPDLADRQGDTPLHVAAQINDYRSMIDLLNAGADPTIRNRSGKTFAPYFAIGPKESMMNSDAKAARRAVRDWLTSHGHAEILQ